MPEKVFFIFHDKNLQRALKVRQAAQTLGIEPLGCWDAQEWVKLSAQESSLTAFIDQMIEQASVIVPLITEDSAQIGYMQYAVRKSHQAKKGLLAIYIHKVLDEQGNTAGIGNTRFGEIDRTKDEKGVFFWQRYHTYRWMDDDGTRNLHEWVEKAKQASQQRQRNLATGT